MRPPPLVLYENIGWPILSSVSPQLPANPDQGTVTNILALAQQQSISLLPTFLAAGEEIDYTPNLMERTQDLRNWLRQAKFEHELLSRDAQQRNN